MDNELITKKFERMGARARFRDFRPSGRRIMTAAIRIDIAHDEKGEYFDLVINPDRAPRLRVPDLRPEDRHLLLMADDAKFLCGHDERHWFVAAVPERARAANVHQAKEALMPDAVHESLGRHRVKRRKRQRRRNDAFLRQGEWFFIPEPDLHVDMRLVLMNEPIRRGAGKPHFVQYLYRTGGETVYVSHVAPNGLLQREYRRWLRDHPERRDLRWTVMQRDPTVYAKGKVRHPDHATINLACWHRVEMNTEVQARAMEYVAFLD